MADAKITQLPDATLPLAGTEKAEIVQGGVNKKVDVSELGTPGIESIVAGTNVTVDATDPANPIVSASGGGGSGTVESVTGDGVDNTDPDNPVISFPDPGDIGLGNVDNVHTIGIQDVNIPSAAMWPRGTDGCAPLTNYSMATSLLDVMALRFGLTGAEYAQTHFTLPRKWNNGTITYQIKWKPEAAGTGDVRFAVQGAAYGNDDALTGAFGTAVAVVDTYIAADDLHVSPVSGALTISGTPAAGDLVALQVSRDPGHTDDTFTQGALFIDITLFITTTAAIDA